MEREQAVEVILQGQAWDPCRRCKGLAKNGMFACKPCHETGYTKNDEYREACVVIGKEDYPEIPMTAGEKIAIALGKGILEEMRRPSLALTALPPKIVDE
jgi:RNA polymerase subunit RPABC4/transcription elongation factor Spt4